MRISGSMSLRDRLMSWENLVLKGGGGLEYLSFGLEAHDEGREGIEGGEVVWNELVMAYRARREIEWRRKGGKV